ncbi:phospho-sugar mutase [Pilimelia columellifera]|uniref:Phospho-sugar mutase n=1 Tax=Pilimelia columellifera subsp. columellifera TaxID=706583 RepID=A0ABN3NK83_9ACTN
MASGDLRTDVLRWIDDDPDPVDRAELRRLLDDWPRSTPELTERFAAPLAFGTAGLRGVLRAGPNGMNLAVVTAAASGLVRWLAERDAVGPLVIGYDARRGSRAFAERTAAVATGAGRPAMVLPRPLPTPVLAYAVRSLGAAAGVMVTASHNPAADNGYKVYLGPLGGRWGVGAQIASPVDAEISAAIATVGPLARVPLGGPGETLGDEVVASYLAAAAALLSPGPRSLRTVYTPLHGVGREVFDAAFARAGFDPPTVVASQARPDPTFPTVAFPNPEEPGAMDRLLDLARETDADLAVANDPDADRCAVAVPDGGRWRTLHGDELGVLLADHLMRSGARGVYATTIVSSSMLAALCASRGEAHAATLTGFKWIVRAGDLAFGYEEALGYCVAPGVVRDKDGITAALLVAELAARLRADGQSVAGRLDALAVECGAHVTDQLAARLPSPAAIAAAMAALRAAPPRALAGAPVTAVEDLLPGADVLIVRAAGRRVVFRPSGTEPKLKAYLEAVEPVAAGDVAGARARAGEALATMRAEFAGRLGGA